MSILDRFRLDGRTAILTGVGPGVGEHVAKAYAELGANVVDDFLELSVELEGVEGDAVVGVHLQDVPQNGIATNLDHGLGPGGCFFAQPSA